MKTRRKLATLWHDENEEFFTKLGERMAELAYEQKGKIPKSFKPSDLELVKTTANDKYKNMYARIYTSKSGKVNCNLSERKEVKGNLRSKKKLSSNERA